MSHNRDQLLRVGMSAHQASAKAAMLDACDAALDALGSSDQRHSVWVPGRIEVLGKHTDYAGGRSLLCTVERGFAVRVAQRDDARIRAVDVATGGACETALDPRGACRGGRLVQLRGHRRPTTGAQLPLGAFGGRPRLHVGPADRRGDELVERADDRRLRGAGQEQRPAQLRGVPSCDLFA
ncbi:MAG: hypothetical protein IPG88_17445 [Gemmatimonadetes bacterium]|nr:hypothetical protein [Gemmatimonadota bacterium]